MIITDIKDALIAEHSKSQTMRIVKYIGNDKNRFKELMTIILGKDELLSQRGAWVFAFCCDAEPQLLQPYFKQIIKKLKEERNHDAIKRNFMRSLQDAIIPEKFQGEIYDIALNYVLSENEARAARVFGMSVLFNIAKLHPELLTELKAILIDLNTYSDTPSLIARSKGILKEMKKLNA